MNQGDTSQSELDNKLSIIGHEIAGLRESVESLRRELTSFIATLGILPGISSATTYPAEPSPDRIESQCNSYVDLISDIAIVYQVLLTQNEQEFVIWTIIDDPPTEDSPERSPYDDERHTLAILENNMPLNLKILSVSEMEKTEQLQTPDMKVIWHR